MNIKGKKTNKQTKNDWFTWHDKLAPVNVIWKEARARSVQQKNLNETLLVFIILPYLLLIMYNFLVRIDVISSDNESSFIV
jgi:hypothetical protein